MYCLAHNLCPAHPHDAGIEDGGKQDATQQEQPQVLDSSGEPPCDAKHKEGEDEEWRRVLQGIREGEARQSPGKPLPNGEPGNVEGHEIDDHRQEPIRVEQDETRPDCQTLAYRASHVDVAPASADCEVAVERGNGDEGSMQAKQGEYQAALPPLLASGQQDELLRHQSQPEHSGERDKADEAEHLPKNLPIAVGIVRDLCQSRLAGACHHSVYRA